MVWQLLFVFIKLRKVCLRNCYTTQDIRFAICVTIYLCWTKGKGRPHISFVRFCELLFVKNSCHTTEAAAMLENPNVTQRLYVSEKIQKENLYQINRLCSHDVTSCWRSKQRNGGHVGRVKFSFGDWTLFLCKFLLLFHYANMATGHDHMSEHNLYD